MVLKETTSDNLRPCLILRALISNYFFGEEFTYMGGETGGSSSRMGTLLILIGRFKNFDLFPNVFYSLSYSISPGWSFKERRIYFES